MDNIPRYLQGELKLLTTACSLIEMDNLGPQVSGAYQILKQYPLHKCGHEKNPVPASECIISMLGKHNENHYIVATQDLDLQKAVREIPGTPLLYLHNKAPVLDPPSIQSKKFATLKIHDTFGASSTSLGVKRPSSNDEKEQFKAKKRKKGGPNPLSCKKKKKKVTMKVTTKASWNLYCHQEDVCCINKFVFAFTLSFILYCLPRSTSMQFINRKPDSCLRIDIFL